MVTAGTPVRLRPMPVGELLDETFKLYRRHFTVIAGVALAVILPNLVVEIVSGSYRANPLSLVQQFLQNLNNPEGLASLQAQQQQYTSSPLYLLSFPLAVLMLPFTLGAVYYAATSLASGAVETVGSILLGTLRRYFGLFGLTILINLIWITFFLLPLFIWIQIRWVVAYPTLLGERVNPLRAVGRSWSLVKGNWWRTFGIFLIVFVMVVIIQLAVGALFTGIAALVPGLNTEVRSGAVTVVAALVNALVGAITPIALTMLYLDLRVRKEGVDLDQLARQTSPGTAPA